MVKYSGYALTPEAETQISGACVGKVYSYELSNYSHSNNWTKVEYFFTTESVDVFVIDEALTEKELMDYRYDGNNAGVPEMNGYRVNQSSDNVSRILDSYLAKKNYNHIIIYSPIDRIDGGWAGLCGFYRSICFTRVS